MPVMPMSSGNCLTAKRATTDPAIEACAITLCVCWWSFRSCGRAGVWISDGSSSLSGGRGRSVGARGGAGRPRGGGPGVVGRRRPWSELPIGRWPPPSRGAHSPGRGRPWRSGGSPPGQIFAGRLSRAGRGRPGQGRRATAFLEAPAQAEGEAQVRGRHSLDAAQSRGVVPNPAGCVDDKKRLHPGFLHSGHFGCSARIFLRPRDQGGAVTDSLLPASTEPECSLCVNIRTAATCVASLSR